MIIAQDRCPRSLSKARHQRSNARLRPALDDERSGSGIDIDPIAGAKNDLVGAGGASHRDVALRDQNRRPRFLNVYRPFRAAYGSDGLWRRHLKAFLPCCLGASTSKALL